MCRGSLWSHEEEEEFERIKKTDNMCINQIKEYSEKGYPTPAWAASEIERAFFLGFRAAKRQT